MNRLQQITLHLAGWAIFITLPILLFPGPRDIFGFFNGPQGLTAIVRYILLAGYFYLNYHLLTPRFYFTKKYLQLALITLIIYFLVALVPDLITPPDPAFPFRTIPERGFPTQELGDNPRANPRPIPLYRPNESEFLRQFSFRFGRHALPFALVFLFSLLLRINHKLGHAEAARQKAELAYLHAQINPHFLFNTLNSIYSLALQKADSTAQAVVKLSNMMRYVLTEAVHDKVSLTNELAYLNNYIELQRLRLSDSVTLTVNIDTPRNGEQIAPMLIVPFIENAFKYGVNPEQQSEITILIKLEYKVLFCEIKNKKVSLGNGDKTQMGIENVRQRLQLVYPQKHTLDIKQSEHDFAVYLSIILE